MDISTNLSENSAIKQKKLGKTGFLASVCGFGSYRIDQGINLHKSALEYAVKNGINLIDTASNYSDGGSEILIGQVLQGMFNSGSASRENLIIVTKGGYIQGDNLRIVSEKEFAGRPYKEVVKCSADFWHCIHPKFLEDQISASLRRLKLDKIDIYLLHNPEYFLLNPGNFSGEDLYREYYSRIKKAFLHLEKEVQKGRISWYGISSNTLGEDSSVNGFTSLETILNLFSEKEQDNHFAVIEFPLNLMEKNALNHINQQQNKTTILKLAAMNNIGVLVNRPLSAIVDEKVIRLADFPAKNVKTIEELSDMVNGLNEQEKFIAGEFVDNIDFSSSEKRNLYDCLSLAKIIKSTYQSFNSPSHFEEIKNYYLIPRVNYALSLLVGHGMTNEALISIIKKYAFAVNSLLDSIYGYLAQKYNEGNKELHAKLNNYLNEAQKKLTLSQKSVLMINSIPEVCSTMVGMRKVEFVKDMLAGMNSDYVSNVYDFWLSD
jgi:aryl-alcohol dehydrogenase-like predicted oxidoreductase